jgi:hypothetical protein
VNRIDWCGERMFLFTLMVSLSNHEPSCRLVLRPFESLRVALSKVEGRQAQDERVYGTVTRQQTSRLKDSSHWLYA